MAPDGSDGPVGPDGTAAPNGAPGPSRAGPTGGLGRGLSRGLGRGLDALIPAGSAPARPPTTEVPIEQVVPNPRQPRTTFDPAALEELTASVREHGIIQPLLVSTETGPDGQTVYQLIAGERRLRAARAAGLTRVPVVVRQTTPQQLLELAIIENIQRADLNPLEEAHAYQRLIEEFGLTQQQAAERVGRSRTAVTNTLRLLDLSEELRQSLAAGDISEGHARALLAITDPEMRRAVWKRVTEEHLSVRQVEQLARTVSGKPRRTSQPATDPHISLLEDTMRRVLGAKVAMKRSQKGRGTITLHFYNDDELDGLLDRLLGDERP